MVDKRYLAQTRNISSIFAVLLIKTKLRRQKKVLFIVQTAIIAALYAALTYAQNFLRDVKIKNYPLLSLLMPAVFNGVVIGWEIEVFFIDGKFNFVSFLTQGGLVALGELGVMLVLGTILYYVIVGRKIDKKIFKKVSE